MNRARIKGFLNVSGFLLLALVLEFVRKGYGIPVTILDIFLFPLSLIFGFILLKDFFFGRKGEALPADRPSFRSIIGRAASVLILFLPVGIWSLWMGIREPFEHFSGVKGAVHGYTMAGIGLFVIAIAAMLTVSVFRSILLIKNTR